MCGIAGFLDLRDGGDRASAPQTVTAMSDSLYHRGPDDGGVWTEAESGIALGQRRLSIVDLSPAGHQPMISANGRYVMVYNGEVYSHQEIRAELEAGGHSFQGHSDTEVILESFAARGVAATLPRLIGMFAIALWDRAERTLTLIRDRLGIKPLYWGRQGGLMLFGSELKALRAHPGWIPRLNRPAISSFLRHNYIPAPLTIYQDVWKLEPGCVLTLAPGREPVIERYWDAREVARSGLRNPMAGSDADMTDRLEALLKDAVGRRMIADVPVGAFLSGGVDSSLVAAMMRAQGSGPVKTFAIGFEDAGFDEAPYAKAVATHLGTDHTELYATAQQARDVIPHLPDWYDEPFADSSQIPTYLVSALTRQHVTVSLSGDGGDELFAGYNRYELAERIGQLLGRVPRPLRQTASAALTAMPIRAWDSLGGMMPARLRLPQLGHKLHKLAKVLTLDDTDAMYRRLISLWEPAEIMPGTVEPQFVLWDPTVREDIPGAIERMQFLDLVTYLPDDILTKVDRASMAVALEARVPLIDHRVVEFSWSLPAHFKRRDGVSKWLLRQVLYRHVPRELIERPKMGFGVPLGQWLRGPLREWAEHLLNEDRLREAGLLNVPLVRARWAEHLGGQRDWQYLLWAILMLEAWRERWPTAV